MQNKFKEKELISNVELSGLVVIFLIILIVLFPKARLKEYILAERSNYNLARDYLQALIKAYPDKSDFVKYLIEFDIKLYDIKDAYKISEKYKNRFSKDSSFQKLRYKIVKRLYFEEKNIKYKREAKEILMKLLNKMPQFVLKEAKAFNFLDLEFEVYKKLKVYNSEFFYLAMYFKDYQLAEEILAQLYMENHKLEYILKMAQVDELLKKFKKASKLYLEAYNKSGKIKFFKKAFYILVWNKKYDSAYKLVKSYENYFLVRDKFDIVKIFLNFYLATKHFRDANNLSLKVMQKLKI